MLIDQQGNIVAKDLRGEDLANKVGELLKNFNGYRSSDMLE